MIVNGLDVLILFRRHALRLSAWTAAFAVLGLALALFLPKSFRASATILPPEDDDSSVSLQQVRRGLTSLGGISRLSSYFTQADVALSVLRSRSVSKDIAEAFDLQAAYGCKNLDDTIRRLRERTMVKIGNEGTITVSVEDENAVKAAAMANAFLDRLDHFNQDSRSFRARRTRQFLEQRVAQADSVLTLTERELISYQKKNGAVIVSPEARSGMAAAGELMSRKVEADIQLELARRYASPSSEEVQRLSAQARELGHQVGEMPATQLGGAELVRQVTITEQVVAMLALQLEDARIREVMDTPTIQVLDRATPPDHPAWPRKSLFTVFGSVLGFSLGLVDLLGLFGRPAIRMP